MKEEDLSKFSGSEIREWLDAERAVVTRFYASPHSDSQPRARMASERVKRLETELKRRSGRIPRT